MSKKISLKDALNGPDAAEELLALSKRVRSLPDDAPERMAAEERFIAVAYDTDPRLRRYAAQALAHAVHPKAEQVLLDLWQKEIGLPELKALAKALGQRGSEPALAALDARHLPSDPLLEELVAKARLTLRRDIERNVSAPARHGALDPRHKPSGPVIVELRCRAGLEGLLQSEGLARLGPEFRAARSGGTGRIRIAWEKPLAKLLELRLFEDLAILVPPTSEGMPAGDSLLSALESSAARTALQAWGKAPYRFRVAWEGEGKQRDAVWKAAALVSQKSKDLLNDPRDSDWELEIDPSARFWALRPKGLASARFSYRSATVDASSHAPLAAALARVGGVYADDIVWDPFCGAGTELVERALLGPYASLHGSDREAEALERARTNLTAAAVMTVDLRQEDALSKDTCLINPFSPSLILTNPPLGRRVTGFDVEALLRDFLWLASRILKPAGRLVWVSPKPEMTRTLAQQHGLRQTFAQKVDMGGFHAEIQRFDQPPA